MTETEGRGPLAGIRVVDLTRAMAGPYATLMLADAGAEVIKVERPGSGDDTRGWGPPFVTPPDGGADESAYFLSVNRNKRSVELDFKDPDDLERLRSLVARADVIAENFRPGVMERLGLGEEALAEQHPRLVGLSITGFGEGGPDGQRSGFDQILQGEGGLMSMTGPVGGPPTKVGVPISDILAGMFGAYGVVAALVERERSGRGQWVRTSLLGGMVAVHTFQGTRWLVAGEVPEPNGNRHPSIAPYGAFAVADGQVNICVGSEGLWRRFAPLVDVDPDDSRFATNGDRVRRIDELEKVMAPALTSASVDDWVARLADAGVPVGRVRSVKQTYESEQVAHLGLVDEVEHASLGTIRLPGAPVDYSRSRRARPAAPPTLGEHTDEVLRSIAAGTPAPEDAAGVAAPADAPAPGDAAVGAAPAGAPGVGTSGDDPAAQAAALLREAADNHHRVYRITDGADEDWALWYADWLTRLSELPEVLGATLVPGELAAVLTELDRAYATEGAGEEWADFYAARLVARFGSG